MRRPSGPPYEFELYCFNCSCPDNPLRPAIADREDNMSFGATRLVLQDLLGLRLKVVWQGVLQTANQATSKFRLLIGVHERSPTGRHKDWSRKGLQEKIELDVDKRTYPIGHSLFVHFTCSLVVGLGRHQ